MRILVVTFANRHSTDTGVGRYYNKITDILEKEGHEIFFFNHDAPLVVEKTTYANTIKPIFSGIKSKRFEKIFKEFKPNAVHIQSEVGLGLSARAYCIANQIPYSSAYHTNWDIGMKYWIKLPSFVVWKYLRWYYKPASIIHAATPRIKAHLQNHGIHNTIAAFPLGVDTKDFYFDPSPTPEWVQKYPRPFFVAMSRISKEKNLEAFLELDLPGTKLVIGNGPYKSFLEKKYHDQAIFFPYQNVRQILSHSDVFIFPSRYDTFGLVILEALACGLPIAGFPVMGPIDIIEQGKSGFALEDLKEAALRCLDLNKDNCMRRASDFSWEKTAKEFLAHQIML